MESATMSLFPQNHTLYNQRYCLQWMIHRRDRMRVLEGLRMNKNKSNNKKMNKNKVNKIKNKKMYKNKSRKMMNPMRKIKKIVSK